MIEGWNLVIGIEIHAQVNSKSKLFSSSPTDFGSKPNSQVSLIDAAMPGMLPVINKFCIEQAVKSGIGLNAKINKKSIFDRKNYFYQDLPQGYQISQYKDPIVGDGFVEIETENGQKKIGVERLHLEQDAGKSLHDQDPNFTFVDLNRSGIALMEIVSKPDMNSPEEAVEYVRKVRSILRYLGTRCEIKNLNSFKFIHAAIVYEAKRQIKLIEQGESVNQETRLFNTQSGETRSMRSKEDAHDYRYFPDPDLLPLTLDDDWIKGLQDTIPELPDQIKERFINEYSLSSYDANIIVSDKATSEYFEDVVKNRNPKLVTTWVTGELFSILNKKNLIIEDSPITSKQLGELVDNIENGKISNRQAKEVLEEMCESGKGALEIIDEKGLSQISDENEIESLVDNVLNSNPENVKKYKNGKDKLFGFFVGEAMKLSKGKANPKIVNDLIKKKLSQ